MHNFTDRGDAMDFLKLLCAFLLGDLCYGRLWVSSGHQEIFIKTCFTPEEVFVNFGEVCPAQGCGIGNDGFDAKIVPHGFIIFCNIQSAKRKIKWLAIR